MDIDLPPPAYAVPYKGPLFEIVLPVPRLNVVCRMLGVDQVGGWLGGCSVRNVWGCVIFLPKVEHQWTQADQDRVRAHERGHCNGWQH
jgi:hypothetical protein